MTREEMLVHLLSGKYNVRHVNASEHEYFFWNGNQIEDQDGYLFGGVYDEFLELRKGDYWESNWVVMSRASFTDDTYLLHNHSVYEEEIFDILQKDHVIGNYKGKTKFFKGGKVVSVKSRSLINRNDPCSCRSGKKYKRCCYGLV